MKKYLLPVVASSIVIAVAFLQCTSSVPAKPMVATQQDSEIQMKATEPVSVVVPILAVEPRPFVKSRPVDKPKSVVESTPVVEPKSVAESTPVVEPNPFIDSKPVVESKSVVEPKPIVESKPVMEPKPVVESKPDDKPVPKEEPATLASAGFTLKLLKATIKGSSSLHDWESQITVIEGKGSFQMKDNLLASVHDAEIKITVKGIKSKEGKKMDNKTYEAFDSDKNPFVIYSFSNALVKRSASNLVTIDAVGKLSMAGKSNSVSLSAKGKELPNGDLHLTVSETIKMTDYNMKPPVMFLGTIKVGDEITVRFDFELKKVDNSN